ncbi:MAG: ATP phosphoribosyltransferase [Phycisphaerales bacterium JB065]
MTITIEQPASTVFLRIGLPKGRMYEGVITLLADAGIRVRASERDYRPSLSIDRVEAKVLKPHNAVEMLAAGSRDLAFAGADWVTEFGLDLVELLDTELDPVRLVAAAPEELIKKGRLQSPGLRVATEYVRLTEAWLKRCDINASIVRSYGATEVFPPEDADFIVDNTATGSTLKANGLEIFDELMTSSTRLYASPQALERPDMRERIEKLVMLISSVLAARKRVILEVNVSADRLDAVVKALPAMRVPTISQLNGGAGYAVKAAVPRADLSRLIPDLKRRGGTDIIVTSLSQIVA